VSSANPAAAPDTVLVVDFGAQYAQLIARRVREARVYSEIVPSTTPVAEMLAKNPAAIILSGGPSSVYEEGAPRLDRALFEAGIPVFGMCYGFQLMAQSLGGTVDNTGAREYGRTDRSRPPPSSRAPPPSRPSGCRTATPAPPPPRASR
jgi:GMP synthase (glutamine-hydrolysing)